MEVVRWPKVIFNEGMGEIKKSWMRQNKKMGAKMEYLPECMYQKQQGVKKNCYEEVS